MKRELTKREIEILKLSLYPNHIIAKKLCIALCTVKDHFTHIRQKLKVKTRQQSLLVALRYNLLGIKDVDMGFWDSSGVYIEDIQPVNLRRE